MPRRSNELGSTRVSFWRDCAVNENSRVVKEKPTPFQRYAQLFQTLPDPQQRDISEELIQYTLDDECYQRYVEKMVHLLEAFATFGQYQFFQAEVIVSVALVEAGSLPDSATVAGKFKSWLEFIRTSCGFDHQQREQGEKSAYHTMVSYIFLFLNDPRLKSVASMETTY